MMEWRDVLMKVVEALAVALIPMLVTLAAGQVVKLVQELGNRMRQRNAEAYEMIRLAAREAVKAAEQANLAGLIEEKKQYAIDYVEKYLNRAYGITVDLDVIANAIEAAVYEEFNQYRTLQTGLTGSGWESEAE